MTKIWIRGSYNDRRQVTAKVLGDPEFASFKSGKAWGIAHVPSGFAFAYSDVSAVEAWDQALSNMRQYDWRKLVEQQTNKYGELMNLPVHYTPPPNNRIRKEWKSWLEQAWGAAYDGSIWQCYVNTNGEMLDGTHLTIVDNWETIRIISTLMVVALGQQHLYAHACEELEKKGELKWFEYDDVSYPMLPDLRLNAYGMFPDFDDHGTPYTVPAVLERGEAFMAEYWGEFVFSDEYSTCSNCGKILRTSPDCYSWVPDYVVIDEDGYYCQECTNVDDVQEEYNRKRSNLPDFARNGLTVVDCTWENGWHPGQTDDPTNVEEWLKAHGIEDWWWDLQLGQFDVSFRIILKPEDVTKIAALWTDQDYHGRYGYREPTDEDEKAAAVLEDILV